MIWIELVAVVGAMVLLFRALSGYARTSFLVALMLVLTVAAMSGLAHAAPEPDITDACACANQVVTWPSR